MPSLSLPLSDLPLFEARDHFGKRLRGALFYSPLDAVTFVPLSLLRTEHDTVIGYDEIGFRATAGPLALHLLSRAGRGIGSHLFPDTPLRPVDVAKLSESAFGSAYLELLSPVS